MRDKDPTIFRLISSRTIESRLWITPSNNVKKLIGGIIARYQEQFQIEIYAYAVLGNHLHLIARAPRSNIDEFEENVNREIARRLNWKHHRQGKFWGKRYDDLKILSEADLLEAFLYVTTNPTKHGLVADSREWEGLHCFQHALTERDREFTFQHYSATEEEEKTTRHRLRLSILPEFAQMSRELRKEIVEKLLVERISHLALARAESGDGFLGVPAIRQQAAGSTPKSTSRKPCPPCYTKNSTLRREFNRHRREIRIAYNDASLRYRLGRKDTVFPLHTFLPPTHRLPRLIPFTPLTLEYLEKIS